MLELIKAHICLLWSGVGDQSIYTDISYVIPQHLRHWSDDKPLRMVVGSGQVWVAPSKCVSPSSAGPILTFAMVRYRGGKSACHVIDNPNFVVGGNVGHRQFHQVSTVHSIRHPADLIERMINVVYTLQLE